MAINGVGAQSQGFGMPKRPKKTGGGDSQTPSMQKLIAYQIGDKFHFNPAGDAVKVSKGDESDYWQSLGYNA